MADPERLTRFRLAQSKIAAKLDDPRTPAYSVAPLTNQLRLVEKELARLTAHDDVDEGLPDPEQFGLVTAISFARWLRRPHVPARRRPVSDYGIRESEIFGSWRDAGFRLSPQPAPTGDDEADRTTTETWVEENRADLERCLAAVTNQRPKEVNK